jgi:hypothetical protein
MTSMSSFDEATPVLDADEVGRIHAEVEQLGKAVEDVAASIERLVGCGYGHGLPDAAMQHLFKACIQLYAQKVDAGQRVLPCGDARELGATSVMVTASGLLKSANLELFELGMWQSFSGTR